MIYEKELFENKYFQLLSIAFKICILIRIIIESIHISVLYYIKKKRFYFFTNG